MEDTYYYGNSFLDISEKAQEEIIKEAQQEEEKEENEEQD